MLFTTPELSAVTALLAFCGVLMHHIFSSVRHQKELTDRPD